MVRKAKKASADGGGDFPKKWADKLPEGYQEKAQAMSTEELEKEVLSANEHIQDTEKLAEDDDKLKVLKEDLAALQGGYKDVLKTDQAKIRYCIYTLRARGAR